MAPARQKNTRLHPHRYPDAEHARFWYFCQSIFTRRAATLIGIPSDRCATTANTTPIRGHRSCPCSSSQPRRKSAKLLLPVHRLLRWLSSGCWQPPVPPVHWPRAPDRRSSVMRLTVKAVLPPTVLLFALAGARAQSLPNLGDEANDDPRGNVHLGTPLVIPIGDTA